MKTTLALIFSSIAVLASAFATFRVLRTDAAHKPLSAYDFSSPASALSAQSQMLADGNYPALIQADIRRNGPKAQEKIRTLQIKKEAEWKGTKLLFISYEVGGIPKFEVAGMEKDASSGLWFPKHVSRYSLPDEAKSLKQSIEAWESDGTLK